MPSSSRSCKRKQADYHKDNNHCCKPEQHQILVSIPEINSNRLFPNRLFICLNCCTWNSRKHTHRNIILKRLFLNNLSLASLNRKLKLSALSFPSITINNINRNLIISRLNTLWYLE